MAFWIRWVPIWWATMSLTARLWSPALPIANNGQCGGDPQGFPQGTAPGQTLAVVPGGNLPGLDDTLVLANNRPTFGSNQVSELVFANTNGDFVATLELPCTPIATNTSGVAYFAADYHAPSGYAGGGRV
jgi:hypothetical protein